jgi:hypothetical protein
MPEHETFDLDAAFTRLERDIAGATSPRGAGLAVTTARRRRRTTYGAIAAVAVLAVGGVAIGQGLGGHHGSVGPTDQPLPPPTPLSAATLSAATAGWVDGWDTPTVTQSTALSGFTCLSNNGDLSGPLNQTRREGVVEYGAGTREMVEVDALEFSADRIDPASSAMAAAAARCKPTETSTTTYADGSMVTHYQIPGTHGAADVELWTAQFGNGLALGIVGGTTEAPSPDIVGRVDDLLVGALQVDGTFTLSPASPTGIDLPYEFGTVSESNFLAALGAWPNGWQQRGTKDTDDPLRCAGDWGDGTTTETGASLGANGYQESYRFDSAEHARSAIQTLVGNLGACAASPADTTTVAGTVPVTVAVGSGSDARVTWIVQRGASVGYLTIPGTTAPPEAVSQAVGEALYPGLEASTPPPTVKGSPAPPQG